MGTNVVKIEPLGGDNSKNQPPRCKGLSTIYMHPNPGKRGLYLDMKSPEGQELAWRVLKDADIFVENMSAGAVGRLELGYEKLSSANPQIVCGNFSGWGSVGHLSKWGNVDPTT